MPSNKGKEKRFKTRYLLRINNQIAKSTSDAVQKRTAAEQRRQSPWMPRAANDLDRLRQEFLLDCLLDPRIRSAPNFGIVWHPSCAWASGPAIAAFAHIFDRSVNGRWTVEVSDDIDGEGNPGWLFHRA